MVTLIVFSIVGFLSYVLELHISTIPFAVEIVIVSFILYRSSYVFLLAFLLGLFLDISRLTPLGFSSMLLIIILFLVSLYQRKFEIRTYPFVFVATCIGSFFFLLFQKEPYILQQSLIAAIFAVLWYRTSPKL